MKTKKNKKKTNKKNSNYKQFRKIPAAVLDEKFETLLMNQFKYLLLDPEQSHLVVKQMTNICSSTLHQPIGNQTHLNHIATALAIASLAALVAKELEYLSDEAAENLLLSIMSIKMNACGQLYLEQRKSKIKCANEMESNIVDWVTKIVRRSLANPESVQHFLEKNLDDIEKSLLQLNGTLPHLHSIASVMAIVMLMAYSAFQLKYISAETFNFVADFVIVMGDDAYKNGANPPANAD